MSGAPLSSCIRLPSALLIVALALVSSPASATMVFTFSDNGGGTTLVTGSGSADVTGGTPAVSGDATRLGWDNFSPVGVNNSTSLIADSDFFTFNFPPFGGVFRNVSATLGATPLNVDGVNLGTSTGLGIDGTDAAFPFFALFFPGGLPQTGVVSASGSAVLNIAFSNLPYGVGQSVDLQNNGDVEFQFVPEPHTALFLGTGLLGLAAFRRRRAA